MLCELSFWPPSSEKSTCNCKCFFQRNKSLAGFVKRTSCVKYASRVKCAAAREGIYFISLSAQQKILPETCFFNDICSLWNGWYTFGMRGTDIISYCVSNISLRIGKNHKALLTWNTSWWSHTRLRRILCGFYWKTKGKRRLVPDESSLFCAMNLWILKCEGISERKN